MNLNMQIRDCKQCRISLDYLNSILTHEQRCPNKAKHNRMKFWTWLGITRNVRDIKLDPGVAASPHEQGQVCVGLWD